MLLQILKATSWPRVEAPYLIIVGPPSRRLLNHVADRYERIWLLGKKVSSPIHWQNVHSLHDQGYQLGAYNLYGTTLWSHLPLWTHASLNRRFDVLKYNQRHEICVQGLKDNITRKTIVLSCHLPSFQMLGRYEHLYATDLEHLILQKKPLVWIATIPEGKLSLRIGETECLSVPEGLVKIEED